VGTAEAHLNTFPLLVVGQTVVISQHPLAVLLSASGIRERVSHD
jgi:hypothetical protein